ncbi:MAG TPA: hypothetical protein VFH17_07345 [Coriobacteriia bacterium]|nr:hypothetical protein [Coriobacteriia bacterium]
MMRHLQDVDLTEPPIAPQRVPDRLLRVTCEQRAERTATDLQHHTRVVGRKGGIGGFGPQYVEFGCPKNELVARSDSRHRSTAGSSAEQIFRLFQRGRERVLGRGGRDDDAADSGEARHTGDSAGVIGMIVCQDDRVEHPHPLASECRS